MGLIFRLTRFREFGERGIEYRREYFLESLGLRFHAGLCQYFFAAHKCQQYCGTHFPVFLELCLYLLVARDLVNFSWICNRCLIHFQLDKPLRESVRKREREMEKKWRMVGSCSIHSTSIRGTKAEFFQLGTIYFSRSFRPVDISKMYRFEKRRNFFSNSFMKRNCETFYVSFV